MNMNQQQRQPTALPPNTNISQIIRTKDPIDPQTRQWQLSSYDIVEEMRHRLNGEIPGDKSSGTSIEWEQTTDPLCNEKGINEICSLISFYLNKNIHLSWFSPEQISEIMKDFEGGLSRKFETSWREYEVSKINVDQIFIWIANTVWAAINRARFGGEKQFIEGTEQRTITSSEALGKKPGFFDNIPVLGGK